MMFKKEKLSKHITRIVDIASVACYLIEGDEKACLLDTCCGYGDLKEYVKKITDKELFVILTHGHYDHTGSAALFDTVYMNEKDIPVLEKHNKYRLLYLEEDKKVIPSLQDITPNDLNPLLTKTPKPMNDGDVFELGSIKIQMVSVPGHTPGMMCALIPEERTIFFGDACGMNVLLHDEFSSDVASYRDSLIRLKNIEDKYDQIFRNHGSFTNGKDLLGNVIECCEDILCGKDDHHPVQMYGKTLYEAKRTENGMRIDGKNGNIVYAQDKVK